MGALELQNRLLIVGESHYQDDNENSKKYNQSIYCTRNVIEDIAIKRDLHGTRIFQNVHRALFCTDNPNKIDHAKFWSSVAFYNFIQKPMKTNKGRPTYVDYRRDWQVFFALVEVVKPRTCLFIGIGASDSLKDAVNDSQEKFRLVGSVRTIEKVNGVRARRATIEDGNNNQIELIFIRHASQFFSWKKWNGFLLKQMGEQLHWLKAMVQRPNGGSVDATEY